MSCMLRVGGVDLNVDRLLEFDLKPDSMYRKGEPQSPKSKSKSTHPTSGVRYVVSNADFDQFEEQKKDAINFMRDNACSIREIMSAAGVDGAELDFGIDKRDVFVQCDSFPAELVRLAGELGLDIMLSQYPTPEEKSEQ